MAKHKVGDKVKVVSGYGGDSSDDLDLFEMTHTFPIGTLGVVVEIDEDYEQKYLVDSDGKTQYMTEEQVKGIE